MKEALEEKQELPFDQLVDTLISPFYLSFTSVCLFLSLQTRSNACKQMPMNKLFSNVCIALEFQDSTDSA